VSFKTDLTVLIFFTRNYNWRVFASIITHMIQDIDQSEAIILIDKQIVRSEDIWNLYNFSLMSIKYGSKQSFNQLI